MFNGTMYTKIDFRGLSVHVTLGRHVKENMALSTLSHLVWFSLSCFMSCNLA